MEEKLKWLLNPIIQTLGVIMTVLWNVFWIGADILGFCGNKTYSIADTQVKLSQILWVVGYIVFTAWISIIIHTQNKRIRDLEAKQPNLVIDRIDNETQPTTSFRPKSVSLHEDEMDWLSSSDSPQRFSMSLDTKDMQTKKGGKVERIFANICNLPRFKNIAGVEAMNVIANITFYNKEGDELFLKFSNVRWENTQAPSTLDYKSQPINSVDIKCGDSRKLYFMVYDKEENNFYIHNDDTYKSNNNWKLERQKIREEEFYVTIELFAENFVAQTSCYKDNFEKQSPILIPCELEEIHDC